MMVVNRLRARADRNLVEQRERVRCRVKVVLAAANHRAELIGGDDLVRQVPLAGPAGLPRSRRSDEHDDRRIRDRRSRLAEIRIHGLQRARRLLAGRGYAGSRNLTVPRSMTTVPSSLAVWN